MARRRLPYPIARAARAIQLASDPKDEYEQVLSAAEAVSITLGASIAAALGPRATEVVAFNNLKSALVAQGLSQGHWISLISTSASLLKQVDEPFSGLREALRRGSHGSGLVNDLETIVAERNRWAHGAGPRTAVEAGMRMQELADPTQRIFERCAFLENAQWILTRSSSFRRTSNDFQVSALDAMGDHPEFERHEFTSQIPLANDTFYLVAARGPVDLTPFILLRYCETCGQSEICFADRLDRRNGVALKSFARGHVLFDHSLDAEVLGLWERPTETQVQGA